MMRQSNGFVPKEFEERVFEMRRVSKKTSGGNIISFSALVILGDKNGRVGAASGKAKDVQKAIQKAVQKAKKTMVEIPLNNGTIPHRVENKYAAAKIMLKPAPKGSGVIAGGAARVVLELGGVKDVSAKSLGSSNKISNVRCTMGALKKLRMIKKDVK